jgi:hypothetical protein
MRKVNLLVFVLILVAAVSSSCKKKKGCKDPISINYDKEAELDDGSCEYAGIGGNVTIVAYPKHHASETRPYHAFVKFNATDFPGNNPNYYDLDITADTTENHIEIKNLKRGKYFIYLTAYDTSSTINVNGGIPLTVSQNFGEMIITIPVTE